MPEKTLSPDSIVTSLRYAVFGNDITRVEPPADGQNIYTVTLAAGVGLYAAGRLAQCMAARVRQRSDMADGDITVSTKVSHQQGHDPVLKLKIPADKASDVVRKLTNWSGDIRGYFWRRVAVEHFKSMRHCIVQRETTAMARGMLRGTVLLMHCSANY